MAADVILKELKGHYRSGRDELASDFFKPCLGVASLYRRTTGYFSTSALLGWIEALPRMVIDDGLKVALIASPELSAADIATLNALELPETRAAYRATIVERILDDIVELAKRPDDGARRGRIFAWLVANERLELRFGFAEHISAPGIFHEKMGIFDFTDGTQVAFTGSANETLGGHMRNFESIDVYRSWVSAESARITTKIDQFQEAWTNQAPGLQVVAPSGDMLRRLSETVRGVPMAGLGDVPIGPADDQRWQHQAEAVMAFLAAKSGILEMATGTGKTRTAIRILHELILSKAIDSAIVTMDGTDLLDQWSRELEQWSFDTRCGWLVYRHFGPTYHELGEFALNPSASLIVISRGRLRRVLDRLTPVQKARTLLVHDEVHGLGVPSLVKELDGQHAAFSYRIGLSATPERAYDGAGNDFIAAELGPTLYKFPIESAIERGVLSEFDYRPLAYELTQGDRDRIQLVYVRKAVRAREGNPMSTEELWTELAKVYKTAEMKPDIFAEFLKVSPEILNRSIIFVETRDYGERILQLIHRYTHRYRTYYADDDRDHLVEFARGEIDCLVTCHRISQGIDIRSLNAVVLFASARAKLETIQRIGRCLRTDPRQPHKRAIVVDFVRSDDRADGVLNADEDRCAWLTALAQTRKKENWDGDRPGTG